MRILMKKILMLILILSSLHSVLKAQKNKIKLVKISGNQVSDIRHVSKVVVPYLYKSAIDLSGEDVKEKKEAFIHLLLPSILIAKRELAEKRKTVSEFLNIDRELTNEEMNYLELLKEEYKCNESKELLSKLHTHPTSIVLAQAAIESGWGTSRFYREANNLFGVWSYNKSEPRIRASEDRNGDTVYVKRYSSLSKSISSYFKILARGPYSTFRKEREKTKNVFILISYLKLYSERREAYVKSLEQMIRFNGLEQYDEYVLKQEK